MMRMMQNMAKRVRIMGRGRMMMEGIKECSKRLQECQLRSLKVNIGC